MGGNARFWALVAIVALIVAGAWFLARPRPELKPDQAATPPPTQEETEREPTPLPPRPEAQAIRRVDSGPTGRRASVSAREESAGGVFEVAGVVLHPGEVPAAETEILLRTVSAPSAGATILERGAVTTSEGEFHLRGLRMGMFTITAIHDDSVAVYQGHLWPGRPVTPVILRLEPGGRLSGRVVGPDGAPVGGARIRTMALPKGVPAPVVMVRDNLLSQLQEVGRTETADEEGRFDIGPIPRSKTLALAEAEGFAAGMSELVEPDAEDVVVTLSPAGAISGRVIIADTREGVGGLSLGAIGPSNKEVRQLTTDDEGRFTVDELREGSYRFALVDSPYLLGEYGSEQVRLTAGERREDVEFALYAGGEIRGRVYDMESGDGFAGVAIRAQGMDAAGDGDDATTDGQGNYVLEGLAPGRYTVMVTGRVPAIPNRNMMMGQGPTVRIESGSVVDGIDFTYLRGVAMRGRVVHDNGAPVAGAAVNLQMMTFSGGPTSTTSERDGTFLLAGLQPGMTASVRATQGVWASPLQGPFDLPVEGEMDGVELVMKAAASLAGTVTAPDGTPLRSMAVALTSESASLGQHYSNTDGAGAFSLDGICPGDYRLYMAPHNQSYMDHPAMDVHLEDGERKADIQLVWRGDVPPYARVGTAGGGALTVTGTAYDDRGNPAGNVRVQASQDGGVRGGAVSVGDGTFEILGLAAGNVELQVYHSDYVLEKPVTVAAGATGVQLRLKPAPRISGRVISAQSGQPIPKFELIVYPDANVGGVGWQGREPWEWIADPEGRFSVSAITWSQRPASELFVVARAAGHSPGSTPLPSPIPARGVDNIVVKLSAGGRVEGKVTDTSGRPVGRASVWVGSRQVYLPAAARTDESGVFVVENLAPQTLTLTIWHPSYSEATAETTVKEGTASHVNVTLSEGGVIEGVVRAANPGGYRIYAHQMTGGAGVNASVKADGSYRISGLPSGEVRVMAAHGQNRAQQSRTAVVAEGQVTRVDFDFAATGLIEGLVTLGGGPPPSDCMIAARISTDVGDAFAHCKPDENGWYQLKDVTPGAGTISVSIEQMNKSVAIEVVAGAVVRQDFAFEIPARIEGAVTGFRAGELVYAGLITGEARIENPTVAQVEELMGRLAAQSDVAADGTFTMAAPEAGRFTLVAVAMSREQQQGESEAAVLARSRFASQVIDLRAGETATINLRLP